MKDGIDSKYLYKVGTNWVFDIQHYIGYKVIRNKPRGSIINFETAFVIQVECKDIKVANTFIQVPIAVLRKSKHLMELKLNGELEEKRVGYR